MTISIFTLAAAAAAQAASPHSSYDTAQARAAGYAQAQQALGQPSMQGVQLPMNHAARVLPAGTIINLTPLEEISSKHMKEGQQFQFIVVNDVTENGAVVIPRGSPAVGLVTMQTGRAEGGKSGKFDLTFESVTANGVTFPLSGVHRQEGKGNTLGALFGSIII
ncbi:MAG TPA: hypothetical protein VIK68_02225, partial [Sphingomicrobium sp.]